MTLSCTHSVGLLLHVFSWKYATVRQFSIITAQYNLLTVIPVVVLERRTERFLI